MDRSFEKVNSMYDLETDRIIQMIIKEKAKKVLLQFPEGMKPYANAISLFIEEKAKCFCFIWLDSCFGACDLPIETDNLGIDLIIQFGHSSWDYNKDKKIKEL